MTDQLESELRRIFAEDAAQAPSSTDLSERARRKVWRRRRLQIIGAAGAVAATATAAAFFSSGGPDEDRTADQVVAPSVSQPPSSGPQGPLPGGGMTSCVEQYSLAAVTGRAFAFDGTVASIASAPNAQPSMGADSVPVTFKVNEWYAGGSGTTVTVDLTPPGVVAATEDAPPTYAVGSRLLVSGEPRFGGAPLQDAIAWGCGFTRYYDEATAAEWRSAVH